MERLGYQWSGLGDPTEALFSTEGYRAAWTPMDHNGSEWKRSGIVLHAYSYGEVEASYGELIELWRAP